MGNALIALDELREATRARVGRAGIVALIELRDSIRFTASTRRDLLEVESLTTLLDMHDKLEALGHGQK